MKYFRLLSCVVVVACGDSSSLAPVAPASAIVSGFVQDSLAVKPVAGAVVQISDRSDTTDLLGAYQIPGVVTGSRSLVVSRFGFEVYQQPVAVTGSQTVHNALLRRTRPFVRDFALSNAGRTLTVTIIDLQGSETIDREWSYASYASGTSMGVQSLIAGMWTILDANTARVSLNIQISGGVSSASWYPSDFDGNHAEFLCSGAGVCIEQAQ